MKIIRIILKDFKTVLSDKKALAIILLMPIVLMVILNFGMRGVFMIGDFGDMSRINIAVVKQYDKTEDIRRFDRTLSSGILSRELDKETVEELRKNSEDVDPEEIFLGDFLGSEEVAKIIEYRVEEEGKAVELLNSGAVSAVVLLPDNFIYDMKVNILMPFRNKVDIRVLTHPDRSINGQVVQSIVEAYSDAMSSVIIGKNVLMEAAMEHDLGDDGFKGMKEAMEEISRAMEGIRVDIDNVALEGRKNISSADYYAVAMMTMFILFAAGHGGRMLLEEKENMTYQRMIAAGTPGLGILTGKFFTVFLIALLQISIMITFSHYVLKVQWGGALPVMLISLASAFSVAGVGSALAAATFKAGNYKMANIFETGVIQTMALLGGSFFPVDILPSVFQKLSFLSLNGTALKAYLKIMMGYGMEDVIGYIGVLTATGALLMVLSALILGGKGEAADVKYNKIKAVKAQG
ncbi:MAG TPA: ABC transporter permease [Clostridia bacterium]|nr:ABC transporter permease [Clostridia bacterium]